MATLLVPPPVSQHVREHLVEIFESPSFRTSARSQQFLQYVVDESLAGRGDSLKERVVGERVFGREPDYDTGQDSIVRVKANEVRRRLAQFYEQHPHAPLRIEMVSGSYGIGIRRTEFATQEAIAPARSRNTYAVGEFVTDPRLLLPVLAAAPTGWEWKNLQILYRVEIGRAHV